MVWFGLYHSFVDVVNSNGSALFLFPASLTAHIPPTSICRPCCTQRGRSPAGTSGRYGRIGHVVRSGKLGGVCHGLDELLRPSGPVTNALTLFRCTYIHKYVHLYTSIYTYICTSVYTSMCIYKYIYVHLHIFFSVGSLGHCK